MIILIFVLFAVAGLAIYLGFYRNRRVFEFRSKMIDTIFDRNSAALQDLRHDPNLSVEKVDAAAVRAFAKYDILDTVSYNEMVLKFWKPLTPESWYADTTFLK